MADFNEISVGLNTITSIDPVINPPAFVQSAIGSSLGQVGNANVVGAIQNVAGQFLSPVLGNQAPFPKRKFVSFMLLDSNGQPATVQSTDGNFQPGYKFDMYVNPKSFKITLPPKTIVPTRTLGGWKIQHWYSEIGSINANGIIGNMLERYNTDVKQSNAWFGFKKLMTVYKNNGIPYYTNGQQITRQQAQAVFNPTVWCTFDKVRYIGYFESLNYEENEETPNTIAYDFSFKILSMMDVNDISSITVISNSLNSFAANAINSSIGNVVLPPSTINSVLNSIKL